MQALRNLGLRSRIPLLAAFLFAVRLVPASAAFLPQEPDILVGTTSFAECPTVAMSANGDFEVVWYRSSSGSHPIGQAILARHFNHEGRPTQAREIRLDFPGNREVSEASGVRVVALPDAGYFVTWVENSRERGAVVLGRFLSPAGRPAGPVLTLARNGRPAAVAVVNDSLLVAWEEFPRPRFPRAFRARRYDFEGHPLGEAMLLTANAGSGSLGLAPLADGFVATWQRQAVGTWIILAQRFSLAGEPLGAALRVNESRLDSLFGIWMASNGDDRFAVAWTVRVPRPDPQTGGQIFDKETRARFFDSGGASGPETRPNQLPTGNQEATGLAMDGSGLALVTWSSDRHAATSSANAAGRFLDLNGQPASRAFPISQNLAGDDLCPAVATGGDGAWVVTWIKGPAILARRLAFEPDSAPGN